AVARFGGSPATESAVEAALRWLARHQEADGHWDIKKYEGGGGVSGGYANDAAVTGMAMLAFLGAGHTHKQGKYRDNVRRAADWLIRTQLPDGGWTNHSYKAYAAGLCTLAMAEAYGMTKDARLQPTAQKGVDKILETQDKYAAWHHGGLRSTSVTGWMVMALKSARIAGLKVDNVGFQGATNWINKVTDPTTGKIGYNRPGRSPWGQSYPMTAVGMVCRQFMGVRRTDGMLQKQATRLTERLPAWEAKNHPTKSAQNPYYWYYGTLAMFQMGGDYWRKWNTELKKTLLPSQRKGGDEDGSWDCEMGWGPTGGRVYTTAINALSLEVYYRYLPMYTK
ncbi:MAG: pectate lyase, partial [Planctomycetota bacterium]